MVNTPNDSLETTLEINVLTCVIPETWCPGADLNHRHADFQSAALPTELPGHNSFKKKYTSQIISQNKYYSDSRV